MDIREIEPAHLMRRFGERRAVRRLGFIPPGPIAPPPSAFVPPAGCVLWNDLGDPAAFTQVANVMTSLTNKITSVVSNTGTLPAYSATGLNGLPTMDFDGSTHVFFNTEPSVCGALANANAHTVIAACKADNADRLDLIFGVGNSLSDNGSKAYGKSITLTGRWLLQYRTDAGVLVQRQSASVVPVTTACVFEPHISGSTIALEVNGTNIPLDSAAFAPTAITPDRVSLGSGSGLTPGGNLDGKISEVLVFNSDLSVSDRNYVRAYLGNKWAITVI